MKEYEFKKSLALFERAKAVIPNGGQGPRHPDFFKFGSYPIFYHRGQGAYVWDVDGNEYIDYMCAFGALVLGVNHPRVEEAANSQAALGDCLTLPTERYVEFAEYLNANLPIAQWVLTGKNGSDVTQFATRIARIATGKKGIVMAHGAYHGFHFWSAEPGPGIPEEYMSHVYHHNYNDIDDLTEVVKRHSGDLAAIIITPVRHDFAKDQELPAPGYFDAVRKLCDKEGMVFIMDDIRCGFRFKFEGSHEYFFAEPDMVCFGKAIANGYPLSALVGKIELLDAIKKASFSATHFYSAVPLAASLACMEEVKTSGAIEKIYQLGSMLKQGMENQACNHAIAVRYTGHPAMPFMIFENDPVFEKAKFFGGEAAKRGIIFHPLHNWFVSAALEEKDIKKTLDVTDHCFKLTKEKFG